MRKFDLMSGHLGNGITVFNRAVMEGADYKVIAHIDANRVVSWRIKNPPESVLNYVAAIVNGPNPNVSATQDTKVFIN